MNLFKAWGFLPLLVELEKTACPHKYRMDLIFPLFFSQKRLPWSPDATRRTAGVKTSCETTPVGDMAVLTEGLLVREWWSL